MIRTKHKKVRSGSVRLHFLPVVVWLVALGAVVFLFSNRVQRFEVIGMADAVKWQITPLERGRVSNLYVGLFDKVTKDQVIATLDSQLVQARLNTIKAEIARLQAELIATKDTLDAEAHNRKVELALDARRFFADVESARLRILQLKAVIEPDKILLNDFAAEIAIEKQLIESAASSTDYNLSKAQAQYDTLSRKITENQHLLAQAEIAAKAAEERRDEFSSTHLVDPSVDASLEALRKAIDVQNRLMDEVSVEVRSLAIKAPADGIVSELFTRPGEVALPQSPILTIAESDPQLVVAYASDASSGIIRQGQSVELIKHGLKPQVARSQIVEVGPVIDVVPQRLLQNPDIPQWGRPFTVKAPPGMKLIPGEKVGIRGLHKSR